MTRGLSGKLIDALDRLGYTDSDGLITQDGVARSSAERPGAREYLWRDLDLKVGLDAAFFHDGVPLVGFTDAPPEGGLTDLRKRLWNYGRIPVLVAATDDEFTVYNGLENPNSGIGQLASSLDKTSAVARDLTKAFSRKSVEAGEFSVRFREAYRDADRVDKGLLTNLRYARRIFANRGVEERAAFDSLVGACITASYMADRDVLDRSKLEQLARVSSLDEALRRGKSKTSALFAGLAERFNGDVFGNVEEALTHLDDSACGMVAALIRGENLQTGQGSLWSYDFRVLPSDLVASIYEQLLDNRQQQDAAYYTPRAIVDLILDEVIPWNSEENPKLIDLACGSGAFLTEAFRRISFKARWQSGDQLGYPELRDLLTAHIFGVDVNPDAAKVAAFGTYLALLEQIDPPTIWASVSLPRLVGTNIVVSDAFGNHSLREQKFDVVVSNPPWKESLTTRAEKFIEAESLPVSNRQSAQAFVWLAYDMLSPGGTLGLVLPSKGILHNKAEGAEEFRSVLFSRLNVRSVVDLSPIRRELFADAIGPTALLIAQRPKSLNDHIVGDKGDHEIIHVTVRPRPFTRASSALVIAPEDLHIVQASLARSRPEIWKTLVWGTSRDLDFLDQVRSKFPSLDEVMTQRNWTHGQGYKVAPKQAQSDASFLIGKPVINVRAVRPMRQPSFHPERFQATTLHRPRDASQYRAPQVVVRRSLPMDKIAATFLAEDAGYTSELMSIAGPPDDAEFLRLVAAVLCSSYGNFWQFMTSVSWGVEREAIDMVDLLDMPLPCGELGELNPVLRAGMRELATPHLKVDAKLFDDLDEVVYDLFGFSSADRRRIAEGLTGNLGWLKEGSNRPLASAETITAYIRALSATLQRSLADVRIQSGFEQEDNYITVWLSFADERVSPISSIFVEGRRIVDTDAILRAGRAASTGTTGLVSLPAAFLIDEDAVYLVKTADRDRWSHDAALDDAARVLTAFAFGA